MMIRIATTTMTRFIQGQMKYTMESTTIATAPSTRGLTTYYRDADEDGYGNANQSALAMFQPDGYVTDSGDCDDDDASIHPDATETCNEIDDDCDGQVDEGVQTTYYRDADEDGFGTADDTIQACEPPTGYITDNTDCDDDDDTVHPGANEINDNIDNNCDGEIDEGFDGDPANYFEHLTSVVCLAHRSLL